MRIVRCTTPDCPRHGLVRQVPDRRAAAGVVYRPELYCADCGAAMADGSPHGTAEKAVRRPAETRAKSTKKRG